MLELDLVQAHLELFGDQHRDRGVGTLPHLDIRHRENDLAIAADADEGVRLKPFVRGSAATSYRKAEAQHQTATGGRAGCKKATSGQVGASRMGGQTIDNHD